MKRKWMVPLLAAAVVMTAACGPAEGTEPVGPMIRQTVADSIGGDNDQKGMKTMKIKVNGRELTAVMADNPTTRALMEKMPMTLPMMNLYGREMCYRFDEALPTGTLRVDRYEVGDIVYWPPRHSFVILYRQTGEEFERQQVGHITEGLDVFADGSDADVTFEMVSDGQS